MAVFHTRYPPPTAQTVQTLATQLHTNLLGAGWTIEYANADAIGTGSAATPAWTKTPATATSAGLVVYRMPAQASLNRWFVQIEFRWTTATTQIGMGIVSAQGVNAGTGVLTLPGTVFSVFNNNAVTTPEYFIVAYEHGFLFASLNTNTASPFVIGCERRRNLGGNVGDDFVGYFICITAGLGMAATVGGQSRTRSWANGEYVAAELMNLGSTGALSTTSPNATETLNNPTGSVGYPLGFFTKSGGLGAGFRLVQLWAVPDVTVGATQNVEVDGTTRSYIIPANANTGITPGGARLAIAVT